jgi:hypothetical protein
MEHRKFIINKAYPLMLNVISKKQAILTCLLYQDLDEKNIFSETVIEFSHFTMLDINARFNLIGKELKDIIKNKSKTNSIITTFVAVPDLEMDTSYYYKCRGSTAISETVDLLIPRAEFVKIKYMLDSIVVNGGYPKTTNEIFKYKRTEFVKIDKIELEGSKVINKKYNRYLDSNVSVIKNAFKMKCGPREYSVVETLGIAKDIDDIDLRIPAPEFVFSKVYKDTDEVTRLTLDDGEIVLVQINSSDTRKHITVYTIEDYRNIDRLSINYLLKENVTNEKS